MKTFLIRFALWILSRYGYKAFMIPPELKQVLLDAAVLVNKWDVLSSPGTSGEYKRGQVYSALIKRFPSVSKSNIAIAIELAIQGVRL